MVEEIKAGGGTAVANYDSVLGRGWRRRHRATALDTFGRIDGVIANAGILRDKAFHKMAVEDWDSVLQVHLYGAFHTIHAAWPHLREQQHGRIVVATSTSGIFGNFGQSNYGAAKGGMIGLINTLAIEGRRANVFANAVAPMAATRMTEDVAPPEVLAAFAGARRAGGRPPVSDELTESGSVFVVGGGRVYRVAQFQTKGVTFAEVPSIDEVGKRWNEISDIDGAVLGVNPVG